MTNWRRDSINKISQDIIHNHSPILTITGYCYTHFEGELIYPVFEIVMTV
jgi:hypothetical protein